MIRLTKPTTIGDILATIRRNRGLSQRALSIKAGNLQSQISAWESGERRPNLASLIDVADALGYDLALIPREDT